MADGPVCTLGVETTLDDAMRPGQRHEAPNRLRFSRAGGAVVLGCDAAQDLAGDFQPALKRVDVGTPL